MFGQPASPASASGATSHARWAWLLLLAITALGAYLRFHTLNLRGLWPAECFSVLLAWQPFPQFLRSLWWGEANMAFYYLLMRGWVLLGDSEFWLLSLSALFGVLAIPAIYALGKRLFGPVAGLTAAALLAVHSSHVEHSEQLRSYSLWVLLAILVTHCFFALLEDPHRKLLWVLYAFLALLFIYTQVFGVFLLVAQWLPLLPSGARWLGVWRMLPTFAAIGVLSLPLAYVMVTEDKGQLLWVPRVSLAGAWEVLRNIVGTDVLSSQYWIAIAVLTILYVVFWIVAITGVFRPKSAGADGSSTRTAIIVLGWSLIFPFLLMTALSFRKPILYPRYLLMSVPAAVLLAAYGLVRVARSAPRGRIIFAVSLSVMLLLAWFGVHVFDGQILTSGNDWRGVSNYILERKQPGDAVIFYNFSGGWSFDYYTRRFHEAGGQGPAPPVLFPLTFERGSLERRVAPYNRVWLALQQTIPTPDSVRNDALLRETLGGGRLHLVQQIDFSGKRIFANENVTINLALYTSSAN